MSADGDPASNPPRPDGTGPEPAGSTPPSVPQPFGAPGSVPPGAAPGPTPPSWGPPPGAPYGYGYGKPVAAPDIPGAEQTGRRATIAIWIGLALYLVQIVASLVVIPTVRDTFEQVMDDIEAGRTTPTATAGADDPAYVVANLVSNLGSILLLVVGILVLIWVHKALSNARALNFRLTHSPGWGVAGFLVPIINFWFPYQAMRDLFPEGNPHRRTAGVWFTGWLGAQLLAVAMTLVGFFSTPAAVAVGVVVAGLYVVAAVNLQRIIAESTTLHRDIAAERGWPIGPTPGWVPGGAPVPGATTMPYPYPNPSSYPSPCPTPGHAPGQAPAPGGWTLPPASPPKDPWSRN